MITNKKYSYSKVNNKAKRIYADKHFPAIVKNNVNIFKLINLVTVSKVTKLAQLKVKKEYFPEQKQ